MYKIMKETSKKRFITLTLALIIIFIGILVGGFFLTKNWNNNSIIGKLSEGTCLNNENQERQAGEKEETTSATLIMVGDSLIHSSVYRDANRLAGYKGYNFKPMITEIKEKVKNFDIAYYNQEVILGGTKIGLSDYPCFNSPYEVGDDMQDAGFNLVSLATNHTMDRGEQAILNSRAYWDKQENTLAVRKLFFI